MKFWNDQHVTIDHSANNGASWSGGTIITNADLVLEEKSKAYTIGQGDNNIDISIAKDGYTPIAVAGINGFGDTSNVRQFMISGTTLRITANRSVSASTSGTANAKILYVRK